jgi:hypothetical protein
VIRKSGFVAYLCSPFIAAAASGAAIDLESSYQCQSCAGEEDRIPSRQPCCKTHSLRHSTTQQPPTTKKQAEGAFTVSPDLGLVEVEVAHQSARS